MADEPSSAPTPQSIAQLLSPAVPTDQVMVQPVVPAPTTQVVDTPPTVSEPVAEVTPKPSPTEAVPVAAEPPIPEEPAKPSGDEEKSPLEILEEILASAGAEKDEKEKEETEKKAAEEQAKAEAAAKEAEYRQEADQKIAVAEQQLVTAKQEQAQVDADHPAAPSAVLPDEMAIHQMHHEVRPGTVVLGAY